MIQNYVYFFTFYFKAFTGSGASPGKMFALGLLIRDIPQGTVDNNLGPDRLAGPKGLDPNYCRQPTL